MFSPSPVKILKKGEISKLGHHLQPSSRGLLGIRRMDNVPNAHIMKLCEGMNGVVKKIDEGVCSPMIQPFGENGE